MKETWKQPYEQDPIICQIAKIEETTDHGRRYLVLTGSDGLQHKYSEKRKEAWSTIETLRRDNPNATVVCIYETFTKGAETIKYVTDIKILPMGGLYTRAVDNLVAKLTYLQTDTQLRARALELAIQQCPDVPYGETDTLYNLAESHLNYIKGNVISEAPQHD